MALEILRALMAGRRGIALPTSLSLQSRDVDCTFGDIY
jgi:hypothetical protein